MNSKFSLMIQRLFFKLSIFLFILIILFINTQVLAQTVEYTVNPGNILHEIDEKVYGHFLEHIYNSVNDGLWGDLIWNRSLERSGSGAGIWQIEGDEIIQSSLSENVRLLFGETSWQNYEFTVQAQKDGGAEGFLIIFRANGENFYWCNLGGWTNTLHAIEKGTPGVRWSVFDNNQISGSIETGIWYNIRVRCESNHFQVWLDDLKIFDFTDSAAHLSGQVGVGTWGTQARYRNLAVTDSASGDTLFSGLPSINENEITLANWETIGNGEFLNSDQALNSNYCVKIINSQAAETGIQQGSIYLKNQNYSGSFWAKGSTNSGMTVALLEDTTIIDKEDFSAPGETWQEYQFELTSSVQTTNGTLRISFNDTGTVYLDQVSMMGQDAIDNNGYRPDLYEAVEALQPPVIRWPGGCYASAYFWKDGIGPQHERRVYPIELWNDQDVNSYGTDEFLQMCEDMDTEPLIVINCGVLNTTCGVGIPEKLTPAEYLQDALDWMEYCNGDQSTTWGAVRAANGHPEPYNVKYWEIDNEVWSGGISAYIAKVKEYAPAMRAKYPNVKIIACGSGSYDQNWNQTLINNCADEIDYISTHHYEDIANYATGVKQYDTFIKALGAIIKSSSNPDIKIYMSEWNVSSGLDWRAGLYAAGMLNTFEQNGDVFKIGGPALFLRHSSANAWNNAFINFNNSNWFPATNYVVMKFWYDHFAPNFIETDGYNSNLNVTATVSEDGKNLYFKVVNTASTESDVKLNINSSFIPKSALLEQIAPGSLSAANSMGNPDIIQIENVNVQIYKQSVSFTVPGYSVVIVTVSQDQSVGIGSDNTNQLQDYQLSANYPNPFNSGTMIEYHLPKTEHVKLQVVDMLGRVVKILINEKQESATYYAQWDGKDGYGIDSSSGVYFYELITDSKRLVKKMTLLR